MSGLPDSRRRNVAMGHCDTLASALLMGVSVGTAIQHRDARTYLRLDEIGAAMAVLDHDGRVVDASPAAVLLFTRFHLPITRESPIPGDLARELANAPVGEAIVWRRAE